MTDVARRTRVLSMSVNGRAVEVAVAPHRTLLEVLRYDLDLVGTKQGCDKGDCGACTVQLDGLPVLSCLTLALAAEGREVRTVEGLGGREHPLVDAFDRFDAAQCGFCTPGVLMSAEHLVRTQAGPLGHEEIARGLAGNLCRCTGYTKILEAVAFASRRAAGETPPHGSGQGSDE